MHVGRQKTPPGSVEITMDTGRHFRSKLLTSRLLRGADIAEMIEIGIRFTVGRHGKSPLDATFRTARASFAWYVDYSKVKAGELTTEQAIRGGLRRRRGRLPANGPMPRNYSQAPHEVRVSLRAMEAQTSKAHGSYPRNGCRLSGRASGNRSHRTPRSRNLDSHKMGGWAPWRRRRVRN